MATAIECGLIAAGISLAAIAVVNGVGPDNIERMLGWDSYSQEQKFLKVECQKPQSNGNRRDVVYVRDQSWFKFNGLPLNSTGYAPCPR